MCCVWVALLFLETRVLQWTSPDLQSHSVCLGSLGGGGWQALERNEIMDAAHSEEFIRLFYQFVDQVGRRHPPLEW